MSRLVLELHVQPGASRTEVAGLHGERLKVRLAAPASDGRANAALIEFLARELGVAKRDLSIASGAASRRKRIVVENFSGQLPWKMPSATGR